MLYKRCTCERKRWPRCEHLYWYKFKHQGRPERGSTDQRYREAAAKEARRARVEIEQKAGPPGRRRGLALEVLEAIDLRRVADKGFRKERAEDIEGLWSPIYRHLGGSDRDVMTLTDSEIEGYEGKRRRDPGRRGDGVAGQTIRRELQALKRCIKKAVRDGKIPRSPVDWDALDPVLSDPADAAQSSKGWSKTEVQRVLAHLSAKALRAKMLDKMRFLQATGLRAEELPRYDRATWLRGDELHVPAVGKNGKPRVIYLSGSALRLAKKFDTFKLGKPNKALKLASERAGFVGRVLTPRDLRAYFISRVAKKNLPAAQRLAGHTNIATTSRYVHIGEDEVRRASLEASRLPKGSRARGHGRVAGKK